MTSPYSSKFIKAIDLQIGESTISSTDLVRNLGVTFQSEKQRITI